MVDASRLRSVGLAVLAVGIVVGPAAVLAGGGPGAPAADAGSESERLLGADEQPGLELLGASGVLPTMPELRPGMVATMVAPGDPAAIPPGSISIPPIVLDSYQRAERVLAQRDPECGLPWTLLAGVGRVISDHARGGGLDERGTTSGPILGLVLDGRPGIAEIPDTDDGRLDGDDSWDRAVGPMQIIPAVWQRVGADSDRDGSADPHNVYDSALAAGRYLCEHDAQLRTPGGQVRAVFRYQRSEPFVRSTMLWTRVYEAAALPPAAPEEVPALPPAETVPDGPARTPARLPSGPERAPVSALPAVSTPRSTPSTAPPTRGAPSRTTSPPPRGEGPPSSQEPSVEPTGGGGGSSGSPLPDGEPTGDPSSSPPPDGEGGDGDPSGSPLPDGDGGDGTGEGGSTSAEPEPSSSPDPDGQPGPSVTPDPS